MGFREVFIWSDLVRSYRLNDGTELRLSPLRLVPAKWRLDRTESRKRKQGWLPPADAQVSFTVFRDGRAASGRLSAWLPRSSAPDELKEVLAEALGRFPGRGAEKALSRADLSLRWAERRLHLPAPRYDIKEAPLDGYLELSHGGNTDLYVALYREGPTVAGLHWRFGFFSDLYVYVIAPRGMSHREALALALGEEVADLLETELAIQKLAL